MRCLTGFQPSILITSYQLEPRTTVRLEGGKELKFDRRPRNSPGKYEAFIKSSAEYLLVFGTVNSGPLLLFFHSIGAVCPVLPTLGNKVRGVYRNLAGNGGRCSESLSATISSTKGT